MTNSINISSEEIRNLANIYKKTSYELQQTLYNLNSAQEKINQLDKFGIIDNFNEQQTSMKIAIKNFSSIMDEINLRLIKFADIIEKTDENITSFIKSNN